jgi:zinc transport system ATP-binding protein
MGLLLEMQSVTASYGESVVLRNVSMKINENDFIGVIGPNGGGKTTLLKLILGLIKPEKGEIIFSGNLLNRTSIGYLPQISTGDVNYPVTVFDVVLSGMMIRKNILSGMSLDDKSRARSIIDEIGLTDYAGASLNELSGGQLQKVFLGRAIIGSPRLLLLDEPGNFVDSTFENDFYSRLKELNSRMAILMVSHDVGMVSSYVKSFACVNRELHYHPSSEITNEELLAYDCPIQLITHGSACSLSGSS